MCLALGGMGQWPCGSCPRGWWPSVAGKECNDEPCASGVSDAEPVA